MNSTTLVLSDRLLQIADRHKTAVKRRDLLHVELQAIDVVIKVHGFLRDRGRSSIGRRGVLYIRFDEHFFLREVGDQHRIGMIASLEVIKL